MNTFIGHNPPQDGRQWDCQCARCGSSMGFDSCDSCGGDGTTAPGELHEQDPLWYDESDFENCHACNGKGGLRFCLSSKEWCEAHPLAGRDGIARSMPEWFTNEDRKIEDRKMGGKG